VPQCVKTDKFQLVERRNRGIHDQVLNRLQIRTLTTTRETLFNFSDSQKFIPLHQPAEFSNNRNVFTDIATKFSELRVFFNEPFHVLDGLNV